MALETIDWTIRAGDLLTVGSILCGGAAVLFNMHGSVKEHNRRLDALEEEMKSQTLILTKLAAGEERMRGLEHRVDLLERAS